VIKEDKVDISDSAFMSRSAVMSGLNTKPYPYEEFMLNQWFAQQQNLKILPTR